MVLAQVTLLGMLKLPVALQHGTMRLHSLRQVERENGEGPLALSCLQEGTLLTLLVLVFSSSALPASLCEKPLAHCGDVVGGHLPSTLLAVLFCC